MWKIILLCKYKNFFLYDNLYNIYSNNYWLLFFFSVYLSALKIDCWYKQNGIKCTGTPVLKCLRRYDEKIAATYFIGCSEWKINEKFHRFISIKENVNIVLLNQLLNGLYQVKYN